MNADVRATSEHTGAQLRRVAQTIETFLNATTLNDVHTPEDDASQHFARGFLSDMRHLLVMTERIEEKIGALLRRPTFSKEHAERLLYDVYHHVIGCFFYPRHESYSEEGRYAYTGQDAIRFRKKPSRPIRDLTLALSVIFEPLRERLSYYEHEYVHEKRMQGERV
ncbi:MAG: YpuI family protein [Paenibacillaceae bacterium]|nr:YpuI family protein [Paenibacillaceae bacterium]